MTRFKSFVGVALLAVVCGCVRWRPSQDPAAWSLQGAVVSITDTTLQVRHKSGQLVNVQIDGQTVYIHHARPESRDSLHRGSRVLVDIETVQRGVYHARVVHIA